MSININGYVTEGLTTENAGMCQWGFAVKNGHEYFIKEFLSPKYPLDEKRLGPELTQKLRACADAFFARKTEYYKKLASCRTGNNIIVLDFFRFGSKYYAVTDRVTGDMLSIEQVARLRDDQKYTLIKSILFSVSKFHNVGIVHSDIKPENVLIKKTCHDYCTGKIIDFDSGFFETDVPANIEGSQNYFSPEALLRSNGQDIPITTKSDVWALGLLFHQYWCGSLPGFPGSSHYAAEAVLNGASLTYNSSIPSVVRLLIERMTDKDPANRPSAEDAWKYLCQSTAPKPAAGTAKPAADAANGTLSAPKKLS